MAKPTIILNKHGELEIFRDPVEYETQRAERKKFSARCGHVKRRLLRKERLTGPLLEFALDIASDEIGEKLKTGETLSDYELHLMVEVYLVHARLASPRPVSSPG